MQSNRRRLVYPDPPTLREEQLRLHKTRLDVFTQEMQNSKPGTVQYAVLRSYWLEENERGGDKR